MRTSTIAWWCGSCDCRNIPDNYTCVHCGHPRREKHAQVHSSEKAVVYYNEATGEHRTPARADVPIPPIYSQQGFERMEILNMTKLEKAAGVVHEATSFNPGNEPVPGKVDTPKPSKDVVDALARDMAAAMASGPWTGGLD